MLRSPEPPHSAPTGQRSSIAATWPLLGLCLALWLITHPYLGITEDARFYNLQFLRAMNPAAYQSDLYFRYGSQDDYSAFSAVFAPVISAFGLNAGNILLNIAFQCLWIGGLWFFLTALVPSTAERVVAFAAAVVLPGRVSFVHYGEPLLTPRLLAEALSLWAFGSMLRYQHARAVLWLALGFLFHPLMTLPSAGVLFLEAVGRRWVWLLLPAFGLALLAALIAGAVEPFARLAEVYDPAWFAVVTMRDGFCLLSNWGLEWLPVYTTFVLACASFVFAPPLERRLLRMAFIVGLGGLAASFIGADLLHLAWVTEAQLWRGVWVLSLVANVSFGLTLLRLWPKFLRAPGSSLTSPIALLIVSGFFLAVSRFIPAFIALPAPLAAIGGVSAWWSFHRKRWPGRCMRGVVLGSLAGALALATVALLVALHTLALTPLGIWPPVLGLLGTSLCLAAVCALILPATMRWDRIVQSFAPAVALSLLLAAMMSWDQRTPWSYFIETADGPPASLTKLLPANAQVYWEGDVTVPWLLLRRSAFSCEQGTGALFSRGTAMAYQARFDSFRTLGTLDFLKDTYCQGTRNRFITPLTRADVQTLCQREPTLDDLVLTKPIADDAGLIWVPPVPFKIDFDVAGVRRLLNAREFHSYGCASYANGINH